MFGPRPDKGAVFEGAVCLLHDVRTCTYPLILHPRDSARSSYLISVISLITVDQIAPLLTESPFRPVSTSALLKCTIVP